jgi:hypothetical protein
LDPDFDFDFDLDLDFDFDLDLDFDLDFDFDFDFDFESVDLERAGGAGGFAADLPKECRRKSPQTPKPSSMIFAFDLKPLTLT